MVIMRTIVIMIKMKMMKYDDSKNRIFNFFIAVRTDIMEQSGGKNLTQTGPNMQFSYSISTIDVNYVKFTFTY